MAVGTGAAILGGSVLGGVASASAADKASDAQMEAAELQVGLQRDIYNETVDRFEPFLDLGTDYSNVLKYELLGGDAPMIGGSPAQINEVVPQASGGGTANHALNQAMNAIFNPNGLFPGLATGTNADGFNKPKLTVSNGGGNPQYEVNGQIFNSYAEAEKYANNNRVGGHQYQGFQATPGYQFALDQGQTAIDNSAAARGNVFSGATLKAQQEFGTGLANQEYGNYLNRLTGQAAQGQAAAGNMATAGANYGAGAGAAYGAMGNAQAAGHIGQANAINGGINNAIGAFGYMNNGSSGVNALTASNGVQVPSSLMNGVGAMF
ncbi:hypothetical protein [Ruegeria arenilitoris]|uniref:hypothetical protein n=1 Tax=Ruegeria arenilitoris TaxID=1173585 RepID=UPI00148187F0|nr:hypothetical protein [Ruegeria arenilitoris]